MKDMSKDYSFYTKDATKEAVKESVKSYKKSLKEKRTYVKKVTSIRYLLMARMETSIPCYFMSI